LRSGARAAGELYDDFVTLDPAADVNTRGGKTFTRTIALEHVSYQYPQTASPAVHDLSLTINRGESIGIVGPTGAGKSTLVDLVLGLLPPSSGRLLVDGTPVGAGVIFRRRVGYVPQSLFLIDDNLRRNIALGVSDGEIDRARLDRVIAMAQLRAMVAALPDGIETDVGERGVRLSGGERQRIAIARALYHDPDFLVFDEATSSLDLATEAEVTRTIGELRGDRTMLVIAHRLTTVRQCDRIVFLRGGGIEAIGTFDELCRDSREFRELAALASV
jgi:ATP-binding cassette, subfamily B, bacterial PglK